MAKAFDPWDDWTERAITLVVYLALVLAFAPLAVTPVLAGLKLAGVVEWPWLWVLSGLWLGWGGLIALFAGPVLTIFAFVWLLDGFGYLCLLTLVLVALKITGLIAWAWLWVLSPFWIPIAAFLAVFVVATFAILTWNFLSPPDRA